MVNFRSRFGGDAIKDCKYVHHMDLEALIKDALGKEFDIQAGEYSQDSLLRFSVGEEPDPYGDEDDLTVDEWLKGETKDLPWGYTATEPSLADVCHELYRLGFLPEGDYVVHIWW